MAKTDQQHHQECMERFVQLANTLQEEGVPANAISAGLMSASGVYATYVWAGNDGGLTEKGIGQVTAAYKQQLQQVQAAKKVRAQKR